MIGDAIARTGTNLLKVGVVVLLSSIANVAVKETTSTSLRELSQDVRRIKSNYKDKYQLDGETN